MSANNDDEEGKKKKKRPDLPIVKINCPADYQRMKLNRLMANPSKPVNIPNPRKEKSIAPPPDFVRNIMGSSAGAGSGEFHVYRHIRRKEYARQKALLEESKKEEKEAEFQLRVEERQKKLEQKSEKNRNKRLKRKAALLRNKKLKRTGDKKEEIKSESSSSSSDDEKIDEKMDIKIDDKNENEANLSKNTPVENETTDESNSRIEKNSEKEKIIEEIDKTKTENLGEENNS